MARLVFEIGFEEMPARFLPGLMEELHNALHHGLVEAGLAFSEVKVDATPRRLAARVEAMDAVQPVREEEVTGPPAAVAFKEGQPTKAAEGFAKGQGCVVEDLYTVETEKGAYVALKKQTGGAAAAVLLSELLPRALTGLTFPKKMRWGAGGDFAFGRPVRWLLALVDETIVDFRAAGLDAGRETWGHRVHGAGPFAVASAQDYEQTLHDRCRVTLESALRKGVIVTRGETLARDAGGSVVWKESLLDEVAGLVEHPVPLLGDFDPSFLELPKEVLLTSMESHQKSFGVQDAQGALLPHFLTTLNLEPRDEALVKKGWERVLKARLEDARFFWRTDLDAPLETWLEALESVVFLGPLGSMGDKSRRIETLCGWLATRLELDGTHAAQAKRAGRICKADLVSEMVGEFPELQGIMGGVYAAKQGEPEAVAHAVAEHYLPVGPESSPPASDLGAILSIADKMDTLTGCFAAGKIPSGANDPFGLRRGALGVCRILVERGWRVDVPALVAAAMDAYPDELWAKGKADRAVRNAQILEFIAARLKHWLISQGFETLHVEAILESRGGALHDVAAARRRLQALEAFSKEPGFEHAALTFKRASNIIRKQAEQEALSGAYDPARFEMEQERTLADAVEAVAPRFDAHMAAGDYAACFALVLECRPAVDAFFDHVMVMAEDPALRRNRLNLLAALVDRLGRLADFNALQM